MKSSVDLNMVNPMHPSMRLLQSLRAYARRAALGLLLMSVSTALRADANPPGLMTYQGYVVDGSGTPLGQTFPANYPVTFRIWDASASGNLMWSENQIVTVNKGSFSVLLGNGVAVTGDSPKYPTLAAAFPPGDASLSTRYIELTVTLAGNTLMTIAPRIRLVSSPFALVSTYSTQATVAQGLANGATPLAASSLARVDAGQTFAGANSFSSSLQLNAGASLNGNPLYLGNTGDTGDYLTLGNGALNWNINGPVLAGGTQGALGTTGSGNTAYVTWGGTNVIVNTNLVVNGPALVQGNTFINQYPAMTGADVWGQVILRGTINADGSMSQNLLDMNAADPSHPVVSVAHVGGSATYFIKLQNAFQFSDSPTVTVSCMGSGAVGRVAYVVSASSNLIQVFTSKYDGTFLDTTFSFIAVGHRTGTKTW
jgi:hypothetical protein